MTFSEVTDERLSRTTGFDVSVDAVDVDAERNLIDPLSLKKCRVISGIFPAPPFGMRSAL